MLVIAIPIALGDNLFLRYLASPSQTLRTRSSLPKSTNINQNLILLDYNKVNGHYKHRTVSRDPPSIFMLASTRRGPLAALTDLDPKLRRVARLGVE